MTRDEILSIASSLSAGLADSSTLTSYLDESFKDFSLSPTPHFIKAIIKSITASVASYSFESDMLRIHLAYHNDRQLSVISEDFLDSYSSSWETSTGTPTHITQDPVSARNYTLYPIPTSTSSSLIPIHGEPFGEDYPSNSLILFYSDDRTNDIPSIYSLPIALASLSKEFLHPSSHTSFEQSAIFASISSFLFSLLSPR